jgi:hypothetical protein
MSRRNRVVRIGFVFLFVTLASSAFAQVDSGKCVSVEQVQAMMADLRVSLRKEILEELDGRETGRASDSADQAKAPMIAHARNDQVTTLVDTQDLAAAQEVENDEHIDSAEKAIRVSSVGSPEGAGGGAQSDFQIIATTDSTRASLKKEFSNSNSATGVYTTKSFVVSAPLDKKSETGTNLATLDGIASGFEVSFNFDRVSKGLSLSRELSEMSRVDRILKLPEDCQSLGILIDNKKDTCNSDAVLDAATPRADPKQVEIFERWQPAERSLLTGYQLKIGQDDFNYYSAVDLSKQSATKVPWSVGGHVGVLGGSWYLGGALKLQQSYKAPSSRTACLLEPGELIAQCVTGSLAAPKDEKKYLAGLEGRRAFGDVGVGVRIQRDFKNDEWRAEVPIYLFRNEDKILNGGLRFGWTTTEKFVAGIFVGVPFRFSSDD